MSNRNFSLILSLSLFCAGLALGQNMETYSWSFQGGNLVSNWSFENQTTEICASDNPGWGGTQTDCHYWMGTTARSGNYAMKVVAKNEGNPSAQPYAISQISNQLSIEPSTSYTFSFNMQVNWNERIPSSAPVACWLRADRSFIGCAQGQPYLSVFPNSLSSWAPYGFTFQTAPDAQYLYFHMVQSVNDGVTGQSGDTYYFDDVQIHKSSESPGVVEARSYANAAGRVDQTIVSDGIKDVITKREYDALGRPSKEYLPVVQTGGLSTGVIVVSALDLTGQLVVDFRDLKAAYDALSARVVASPASSLPPSITFNVIVASDGDEAPLSGVPYDIEVMKTSDGVDVPFDVVGIVRGSSEYADLIQSHAGLSAALHSQGPFTGDYQTLLSQQYPGESNLFTQYTYPTAGVNTISESSLPGSQYGPGSHTERSGTALLSSPVVPASVEDYTDEGDVEAPYLYSWTRDPQGKYTAQIQDERGLVLKSGVADAVNPTDELDWLLSRNIYDDFGRQTALESPAGVTTQTVYNGQSQVIQTTDPDRGMNEVLYDSLGRARFTRSPDGRINNYMVVMQYDGAGRVLGTGRLNSASTYFTQANADNATFPGISVLNQGSLYDALEPLAFEEATGSPLTSLGGFIPSLKNGQGKVVVAFNRNLYAVPPGSWTQAQLLVATFNSYDSLGRLQEKWKYIGAAPAGQQWHKFRYEYDVQGRMAATTTFNDQTESLVVTRCNYIYDPSTGKVTEVVDKDGNALTQYTYDVLGRTTSVDLLGNAEIAYSYDVQNKPLSITGYVQGKNLFQELMGYESKPNVNIANTDMGVYPRFDGTLSSLIRKFSNAAPNPVEWWRYAYDIPGRMIGSYKHFPSSGGALTQDGNISYPVTFNTAPAVERDYEYSDDGAIQSQIEDAQTYVYGYANGTHRINSVTPNLPGRTTAAGNFVFDANGRLWKDIGTGKTFLYNFVDRLVRVLIPGGAEHFLFDENENRVVTLDDRGGAIVGRQIEVYESGLKVAKEIVHRDPGHPDGAMDLVKYHEYGKSGLVSIRYSGSTKRQVLLKDHQGSVMASIEIANGGVSQEQGYHPYGVLESRVAPGTDLVPRESFTGKEYVEALRLYDFGARFYDPEIGLWLVPDAAGQYANPYSYSGAPINGIDLDGNWFIVDDIIGGVVGAGIGAYTAFKNGYDLTDWQTYAYIGGGAAIGVATVETGGAAGAAFSSLGAIGSGVAAGAAGGAIGGLANYSLSSGIETGFSNYNAGDAWKATWTGAAAGAVGGGVGGSGILGRGVGNAFGSGFAGGATGAALNGASARGILIGGLVSGGISAGAYTLKTGVNEVYPKSSHGTSKVTGEREASDQEKAIAKDFRELRASEMQRVGHLSETGATYRDANAFDRWWRGPGTLVVRTNSLSQPGGTVRISPGWGDDYQVHSHPAMPGYSSVGVSGIDGDVGQAIGYPEVKFYMWADELPQQQMYQYDGQFDFYHLTGY